MKKNLALCMCLFALTFLTACGEPTFDSKNPGASAEEMVKSLETEVDIKKLGKSFAVIEMHRIMKGKDLTEKMDGMTVEEINVFADEIRKETPVSLF